MRHHLEHWYHEDVKDDEDEEDDEEDENKEERYTKKDNKLLQIAWQNVIGGDIICSIIPLNETSKAVQKKFAKAVRAHYMDRTGNR